MNARLQRQPVCVDLRKALGVVTWNADRHGVLVRLSGQGGDVALDLGPDAVARLKQVLAQAGDSRPTPAKSQPALALCA